MSYLSCDRLYHSRQIMILDLSMLLPWSEIAHFPVVSIISKPHLGSYQKNFVIMNNNTAVVYDIFVNHRPVGISQQSELISELIHLHPNITKNIFYFLRGQNLRQNLPRVKSSVPLQSTHSADTKTSMVVNRGV